MFVSTKTLALRGNDLTNPRGGKMCVRAVCSIHPKVDALLSILPPSASLPRDILECDVEGCGAKFRMENPNPRDQSGMFTAPAMRRKADRAFLDVAERGEKPKPFLMRLTAPATS